MENSLKIKGLPPSYGNVTRDDLALMRGWLEGVDLEVLGSRYATRSGEDMCAADVRVYLRFVGRVLEQEARRRGRPWRDVRLLRVHSSSLKRSTTRSAESLEDFQLRVDPDGFYTEGELIELFEQNGGVGVQPSVWADRASRLRERQLTILREIENTLPAQADLETPLSFWFDLKTANALEAAGLCSLGDLMDHVEVHGLSWARNIRGIGRGTTTVAHQVLLTEPCISPRMRRVMESDPYRPRVSTCGPIAPLDLVAPPEVHRHWPSAIWEWLDGYSSNQNTFTAYRREVERYFLFCCFGFSAPLEILSSESISLYRRFLYALGRSDCWDYHFPQSHWVGPRHIERTTIGWRPFTGALTDRSQTRALDVVAVFVGRQRAFADANKRTFTGESSV